MRREYREPVRERFPHHRLQRKPLVSDPDMHHGTWVTHVPWCMSGSLTRGGGKTSPAFPAHAQPVILRIWQEAHWFLQYDIIFTGDMDNFYCLLNIYHDTFLCDFKWYCASMSFIVYTLLLCIHSVLFLLALWFHKMRSQKLRNATAQSRNPDMFRICLPPAGSRDHCQFGPHCNEWTYRKVSNISRTQSQNWNDSHLVLKLSSPNPLKPGVKSRMKM